MNQLWGMKIANMNLHYFYYSFDYFLEKQRELGVEKIEFYGQTPHFWIDHEGYEDCKELKRRVEESGARLVAFTPKPYNYSLCASQPWQREKTEKYYKNCIAVAAELGLDQLNISPQGGCLDDEPEKAFGLCKDMLTDLCHAAEQRGVSLALKSARAGEAPALTTLEEMVRMKEDMGRDNLKICLDAVNMSAAGETLEQWFAAFPSQIAHVHFAEENDEGVRLGQGCCPAETYLKTLRKLGYQGILGLQLTDENLWEKPFEADKENLPPLRTFLR